MSQTPNDTIRDAVLKHFPKAQPIAEFSQRWRVALEAVGITPGHALLCVGACRDELCDPFIDTLEETWGSSFRIGSLGGMITLGKTGIAAAAHHAPEAEGEPLRYVGVATTHIGIDDDGTPGQLTRPGQHAPSSTCGALMGFRKELSAGVLNMQLDPTDPEMSLLRQRLAKEIVYGEVIDSVGITRVARDAIGTDLEETLRMLAPGGPAALGGQADVSIASVSGILIHTSAGDWFEPHKPWHAHGRNVNRLSVTDL